MRIGKFTVPDIRLYPTLVETVRVIYGSFDFEEITDPDALAQLLGHKSAHSGAFLVKMSALRKYGLIEGRASVRVTEIGRNLVYPESRDAEIDAIKRAIDRIEIWRELYRIYGPTLPEKDLPSKLASITGCSLEEAQEKEVWVRREYTDDVKYLGRRERSMALEPHRHVPAEKKSTIKPSTPPEAGEVEELKLGDVQILIRPSLDAVKTARALLDLYEHHLKSKMVQNEK